jgi:hypothetical protein
MSKTYTTPALVAKDTIIELTRNGGLRHVDPSGIPGDQMTAAGSVGFAI